MPKVSIIIPMYNVENYIEKCLDSVMNQTMKDYEVIVIDDGSQDHSYNKAIEYQSRYPQQIRVYKQENAGQGAVRNNGVRVAVGEYILFVDSDDTVSKELVETASTMIESAKADIAIFDAWIVHEDQSPNEILIGCHADERIISLEKYPRLLLEYPCPWNKIYRKDFLIDNELKYPTHMWYEDLTGACMFYACAKSVVVSHEKLYYYLQRSSSVMHSKVNPKNIEILKAMDLVLDYYKQKNIFEKYYQELEYLGIYHILIAAAGRTIRGDAKSRFPDMFMKYMNERFPQWRENVYYSEISKANKLKLFLLRRRAYTVLHFLYKMRKANAI